MLAYIFVLFFNVFFLFCNVFCFVLQCILFLLYKVICFVLDFCKVGFGICLDLRFPEMSRLYADKGVHLLNFMGGFSLKTGPAHLETLMRARAIDNQVFLANVGEERRSSLRHVWSQRLRGPLVTYNLTDIS